MYKLNDEWKRIYALVKDDSWPECPDLDKFYSLPDYVKDELIRQHGIDPMGVEINLAGQFDYKYVVYDNQKSIKVFYTDDLDGGGSTFGQDYVKVLRSKYPNKKFSKIFEWCSGSGFIGFSLLSHNFCDRLCFTDFYDPAIESINQTINYPENNCADIVTCYLIKDLKLLPSDETFDLVVANPPHFDKPISFDKNYNRLSTDPNWRSHKNFFENIKSHLSDHGIILLQECSKGSSVKDFEQMIRDSDLFITDTFESVIDGIYYIEIRKHNTHGNR